MGGNFYVWATTSQDFDTSALCAIILHAYVLPTIFDDLYVHRFYVNTVLIHKYQSCQ